MLKKIGGSYKLKQSLVEKEIYHDETYEVTWEDKQHGWFLHL